jgi:hypothetical protein
MTQTLAFEAITFVLAVAIAVVMGFAAFSFAM